MDENANRRGRCVRVCATFQVARGTCRWKVDSMRTRVVRRARSDVSMWERFRVFWFVSILLTFFLSICRFLSATSPQSYDTPRFACPAHIVARGDEGQRGIRPSVMGRKRCPHGKRKDMCKECTPCPHSNVKQNCAACNSCPHGKLKHSCVECNPCPHGKVKKSCAACNPCPHGKLKHSCVECTPCLHGKLKKGCAACNPCPHGKPKYNCAECTPCPHGKLKRNCALCSPCPHGKLKYTCAACKAARAAAPSSKRVKREKESSPEIKQEPEIKQTPSPEIKQEPFTIRGYFGFDDGE